MKTGAPDRLLDELQRLNRRLDDLDRRLGRLEGDGEPQTTHLDEPPPPAGDDGELRDDVFGPDTQVSSAVGHKNAVNKALSMLGLVPEKKVEPEQTPASSARHKQALNKAFDVLGITRRREVVEPARAPAPAPVEDAAPEPEVAAAREPAPAPAPVGDEPPEFVVPDAEEFVPLPELARWEAAVAEEEQEETDAGVDLDTAVPVDLARGKSGSDYAVPILNAAVLAVAGGAAALYGAGVVSSGADYLRELGAGCGAVVCGASALLWRRASPHLRAALAGASALLLHALVLIALAPRLPLPPVLVAGACGAASLVGAWLVMRVAHPLAIFVGFCAALILPSWLAPQPELFLAYAAAVNLAVGYCALRLRRVQASVAAAMLTLLLVARAEGSATAMFASFYALTYLVQVYLAPILHNRPSKAAALLAVPAYALVIWTVHGLVDANAWLKAGVLCATATVTAVFAARLHRREELLRGVSKAAAIILLLAALPTGFAGPNAVPVALFIAALFGVFAFVLYDAYLRAAGALTLVVSVSLLLRAGPNPWLFLATSAVASVLYAARVRGLNPIALPLLLGGLVHGTLLAAVALLAPASWVAYLWLAIAVAFAAAGEKLRVELLRVGAFVALAAGALWALAVPPPDPLRIAICVAALVPHLWLSRALRGRRARSLFLVVIELLAIGAATIALPGPLGVLAALAVPAVLAAPWWWRGWTFILRAHARFCTFVLLARCLFPDVLSHAAAQPWLNLRMAAVLACIIPALLIVRFASVSRKAAAVLAACVGAATVYAETGVWPLGLVTALVIGGACHFLMRSDDEDEQAEQPETDDE